MVERASSDDKEITEGAGGDDMAAEVMVEAAKCLDWLVDHVRPTYAEWTQVEERLRAAGLNAAADTAHAAAQTELDDAAWRDGHAA